MPVPAEVNWTSPRFNTSTLPIESLLIGGVNKANVRKLGYSLFQFSGDDVREYLELAMTVSAKAGAGLDAVFIDHTKRSELRMFSIVIPIASDNA
jgi:predicted O-methyltransferase YrrM